MKTALITGINGQDGSYLTELLLNKGYEVHGVIRRGSTHNPPIQNLQSNPDLFLHYGDMTDDLGIYSIIKEVCPDELYHLAAMSDVKISFDQPLYTFNVNALGTLRVLESVKSLGFETRIYNASTSEMYGSLKRQYVLDEQSRFHPDSPYGTSKLAAYHMCCNYRDVYGLFICNGILFNHESPRRGVNFVTRKITSSIAMGVPLVMGNLESVRDWGYAPEYVDAMWRMLQQDEPDDYVIATGETHSVHDFIREAMNVAGYEVPVSVSSDFLRPRDVVHLWGDATKARLKLGWEPRVRFKELVRIMMEYDIQRVNE